MCEETMGMFHSLVWLTMMARSETMLRWVVCQTDQGHERVVEWETGTP